MQLISLIKQAFWLSLVVISCSCQEQPSAPVTPTTQQYRLKKSIWTSGRNTTVSSYSYNKAGQLASYTIRSGESIDSPSQTTTFTYDQQGKLTRAERLPAPYFLTGRLTYAYDDQGNLFLITLNEDVNKNGQFKQTQTVRLDYGADKLPIKSTSTTGVRVETTLYTYSQGNVIKTERLVTPSSEASQLIQYRHDDKPNPTFGLPVGMPSAEMFNKNNILYEGCELTYSNGLLTGLHTNIKESIDVQSLIRYEYEAY